MVSVVSSLNVLVSPVRVLTEICICSRRRTSFLRLGWGVDLREDKALLVGLDTLEGDTLPRAGLVEDLHLCPSSSVVRLTGGRCCA